jgi:hypothetical protein
MEMFATRLRAALRVLGMTAGLLIGAARPISAQPPLGAAEDNPFGRHAIGVEFGLGLLSEAWNLNEDHEWLVDGTVAFSWAFATGRAVVLEFHNIRVFQATQAAFVQGFSPLLRWRMHERGTWRLYAEVGPGVSWSDFEVPRRGTRFNYLFQGGFGVQRRLGTNVHFLTSFRFLHLSNNGREGVDRNPDIEALGAQTGVFIRF